MTQPQMPGQLPLFTLDGCDPVTQQEHADEVCPGCRQCLPGPMQPSAWRFEELFRAPPQEEDE